MTCSYPVGRVLGDGAAEEIRKAMERLEEQPVDERRECEGDPGYSRSRTTLKESRSVSGPGTYQRKSRRTIRFEPSAREGWWLERSDLPEALPTRVSTRNVWTTARNIVLRSGSPHNYVRMVEHIVALRTGLGIDDARVRIDSGDPPLFNQGSLDLVHAVDEAGVVELEAPARWITVREPVALGAENGRFLLLLPAENGDRRLHIDCAIDFSSAIGKQRIVFDLTPETFRYGAQARTNASLAQMLLVKMFGWAFADTRHLGYTRDNILVHGRRRYANRPRFLRNGRSLEAVWHRATLDLLAAVALVDVGRLAGTLVSYRAGHTMDVRLMTLLYRQDLLREME